MANVVDIRNVDIADIDNSEVFAIDTNALIWTHYSKASNPNLNKHSYQVVEYPNFISKLLQNGNRLVTTTLNISELCGVVERNEYKIYKIINSQHNLKLKDFRKLLPERANYKIELDNMIMEINTVYDNQIEIIEIGTEVITDFQNNITSNTCDLFDYTVIEYLKKTGVKNYISDDKDFISVRDINLYTTYEI